MAELLDRLEPSDLDGGESSDLKTSISIECLEKDKQDIISLVEGVLADRGIDAKVS